MKDRYVVVRIRTDTPEQAQLLIQVDQLAHETEVGAFDFEYEYEPLGIAADASGLMGLVGHLASGHGGN